MEKEELQLKDIACYLPYGLQVQFIDPATKKHHNNEIHTIGNTVGINVYKESKSIFASIAHDNGCRYGLTLDEFKPLLHPLTDLYKPCLEDGKIPIVELAKLCKITITLNYDYEDYVFADLVNSPYSDEGWIFDVKDGIIGIYSFDDKFSGLSECIINLTTVEVLEKLSEWHFDINNLIERGLAIDINTVE